jgi:hypothetical protein
MQMGHLWQNGQTTLFAAEDTATDPSPYCSAIKPKPISSITI